MRALRFSVLLATLLGMAPAIAPVWGQELKLATGAAITTLDPDRKSTRLNSSHIQKSRMPSSA